MNPNQINEIRKLIAQARQTGKRPHYCDQIKSLAKALLKEGISRTELANATGISRGTIENWSKGRIKSRFRKLKVANTSAAPDPQLKITLPSGIGIECSSVSLLKSILEQCS